MRQSLPLVFHMANKEMTLFSIDTLLFELSLQIGCILICSAVTGESLMLNNSWHAMFGLRSYGSEMICGVPSVYFLFWNWVCSFL